MDSHWTDENKIAGLCNDEEIIPATIYNGLNTRAPEDYVFKKDVEGVGSCKNSDFQSGPDLHLIHQMLHLVEDVNVHTDISQNTENPIEISEITKNETNIIATDKDIEKMLKKKKRNVAIESILEGITNECNLMSLDVNEYKNEQVKLLKPEDFVLKSESSIDEANKCDTTVKGVITDMSAFVFKKKSPDLTIRDNDSPKCEPKTDAYQPSSMAEMYYKKYLERSKFKERMQQSTEEFYEKIIKNEDIEAVQLPYHRHMLVQDCIVCNIICRKFFK